MKVKVNSPCSCGSGKKYKYCCLGKKSRTYHMNFDFGRPVQIDRMIYTRDGRFFFGDRHGIHRPESVAISHGYKRASGKEKVLQRFYGHGGIFDQNEKLTHFYRCFAIDTNTKTIANKQISISGITLGNFNVIYPYVFGKYAPIHLLEFENLPYPQEKYGWAISIERIIKNPKLSSHHKIGLIVDSHLGDIDEINSRARPVIEDVYLPVNFELIYASSDGGAENLACKMIRCSDNISNEFFDCLLDSEGNNNPTVWSKWQNVIQYRIWNVED